LTLGLLSMNAVAVPPGAPSEPAEARPTVSPPASPEAEARRIARQLEDEWAEIFYRLSEEQHEEKFRDLLGRVQRTADKHPDVAELLVLQAIVLCTYAGAGSPFTALGKVERARELLIKSIHLDPRAMEASAFITLGNLYYRLPGWPISYGDDESARQYLEAGLKLYPDNIDTNYFYGDFLLEQGEYDQALPYLEKAHQAPIRPHMELSDRKLKEEIGKALVSARAKQDRGDFFSAFEPDFKRKK
jgi:tetratricopeptide (TPR) repeat protein